MFDWRIAAAIFALIVLLLIWEALVNVLTGAVALLVAFGVSALADRNQRRRARYKANGRK